jgi:hypothetical protein
VGRGRRASEERSPRALLVRLSVVLAALALAPASPGFAQLAELETRDLRLVYFDPTLTYVTPHAGRCFENALGFHRKLFSYTPSGPVTVLLDDFADHGNAAATAVPRNFVKVDMAPLSFAFETVVANERINWLMNHELVHVTAQDQAAGSDRFFRGLFRGKVAAVPAQPESILYFYLTTPRAAAPRWYQEGLAVFVETWMAGGQGRAQGAYDEMVFRSMVKDGARFYDPLGLVSEGVKVDFQTEVNSYLYGTRFMSYLAHERSPELVIEWARRGPGTKAYYASQFHKVFGRSLDEAWRDWIAWERVFQQKNLDAIRTYPLTPHVDLSPQGLGSVSRAYYDAERQLLYAGLNYPGVVSHVGAISIEDGSVRKLTDIKGPRIYTVTSLAWDPASRTLFYTSDNNAFRDLLSLSPDTGDSRMLMKDARVGELVFRASDRSLFGIRALNGLATLVRIPHPYTEWQSLYTWPYGEVAYDLDLSPDGTQVSFSHGDASGKQSLRVSRIEALASGDAAPLAQFDFGSAIPSNFVFSPDGRYLYGSSYYTGVSNVFRYELSTGKLDAMSNTETGLFRPLPLGENELVVFRYTGQGFVPARIQARPLEDVKEITFLGQQIAEKHPVVRDWKLGSPAAVPFDSLVTGKGRYGSVGRIRLESIYPVTQGYKEFAAVGMRANFSDPLFLNRASLTASYTPDSDLPEDERYHVQGEFQRYDWTLGFQVNGADFYDLVGPTKTSLKGWAVGVGYNRTLVYDVPRRLDLEADVTYYGDLDRIPDYQGIPTNFTDELATRVRLRYQDFRHSLGYVDEEKGLAWELGFSGDRVKGEVFPKLYSNLDLGLALPIKHSSLWLRGSAGWGPGDDRDEPFANFYFGGFRNNWVDYREEKRYRESPAFPGLEINEVGGTNYARGMVEWNLPPLRFRGAGTPSFYLTWLRPALFSSVLVTNADDGALRRSIANAGAQVDLRLGVLSRLELTLSAGYAAAFESDQPTRHEGMLSLKVLR